MRVRKAEQQEQQKRNEQKWTKPVMAAGYTVIPYVIIDRQDAIGLTAVEMNLILHLANLWWRPETLPFPSKAMLAKRMDCSTKTVQRAFARLERDGLIERKTRFSRGGGQMSNYYDFAGLIKAAEAFAQEELARREKRKSEDERHGNRKRPLRVVKDQEDEE